MLAGKGLVRWEALEVVRGWAGLEAVAGAVEPDAGVVNEHGAGLSDELLAGADQRWAFCVGRGVCVGAIMGSLCWRRSLGTLYIKKVSISMAHGLVILKKYCILVGSSRFSKSMR